MNNIKNNLILIIIMTVFACNTHNVKKDKLKLFVNYFEASQVKSDKKWNYTADTVRLWFDDKVDKPILQIKGDTSNDEWKGWDEEMNSTSYYDSIWFDKSENSIKGYFYENNDFYALIGKSPTKTLRTYSLNQNNKVFEILMYWIPEENTTTSEHLKLIFEWAIENDSVEIQYLYPNKRIIPSRENAKRWKNLIKKYKKND